ncbi:hypothetical protein LQ938_02155 [Microbacterium sp. cx-55]|uniref:hypothetical protein n=1 Tax=Microbacterium sp. cx-55 TaxID=2875948 RepID=UPI001CC14A20|nr:hypothetical protein [Microbacterium sp. cx-55]MBZ4487609.1 hypothetical protein [Microbacterium sp. cx-55]UGB35623.1 hypothetical protein LQ938_02155 [Microbacterium sp. cx-55]
MVRIRTAVAGSVAVFAMILLTACAPDPSPTSPRTPPPSATASAAPAATPTPTATPVAVPTDCRALVSEPVLAQFGDLPLNDPAYGSDVGTQADGSLVCLWGRPDTDTGRLSTTISRMARGPALDLLNGLADSEGYTCYTPDGGTRCEKTWIDEEYPVTDGRTLFWRDDILIDTSYRNLAPSGYTDSVIAAVFG